MKFRPIILFFFFPVFISGQRLLNADSLKSDFSILKTALVKVHPLIQDYMSPDSFDVKAKRIEKLIAEGQILTGFRILLDQFLSTAGCGHTYVYHDEIEKKRLKYDLPFGISLVNDSIYITSVYVKDYDKYFGASVLSINEKVSSDFLNASYKIISSDGNGLIYKKQIIEEKFRYYLDRFLNNPGVFSFATSKGRFTVSLPTGYIKPGDEKSASFRELQISQKTVYLSLPNFDEGRREIKNCFEYMNRNKISNLVIDLRNNGGGNGNIGSLLLSYIVDSNFVYHLDKKTIPSDLKKYFYGQSGIIISNRYVSKDSVTRSYSFYVRKRKKNHYHGNIYVLINRGTFSSAAYTASVLKYKTKAVFIGEESGGSQNAIGGGVIGTFCLPYSGMKIKFPLYKWDFNTTREKGHGVYPDFPVSYDISDLNRRDPGMRKAIELIEKR